MKDLENKVALSTINAYTTGERKITANIMDKVSKAWEIVKNDFGTHIIASLILSFLGIISPFLISGYYGGLYRERKENVKMDIASIFNGFEVAGKLLWIYIFSVVVGILVFIFMFVMMLVPGLLLGETGMTLGMLIAYPLIIAMVFLIQGITVYAIYLMTFSTLDGQAALKASAKIVRKNIVPTFVFLLIIGIVQMVGLLLCGIGIILTYPISIVAMYLFCAEVFNGESDSDEDQLDTMIDHLV